VTTKERNFLEVGTETVTLPNTIGSSEGTSAEVGKRNNVSSAMESLIRAGRSNDNINKKSWPVLDGR
jgi:hypothetical protein